MQRSATTRRNLPIRQGTAYYILATFERISLRLLLYYHLAYFRRPDPLLFYLVLLGGSLPLGSFQMELGLQHLVSGLLHQDVLLFLVDVQ